MAEFHYARYPRAEWRDALLKMKACGINVVASYVFWIHHEEVRGEYDWGGQRSLRDFLQLCHELNLCAFVRMGPWCHGEARNGGFPDWLQRPDMKAPPQIAAAGGGQGSMGALQLVSPNKLRTADPDFLKLTEPFYRQIATQMQGLLWKDGGPVIAVQFDNESNDLPYLLALKRIARELGVDVPFYCMTGWGQSLPMNELIPLFGGYADGFWTDDHLGFRDAFTFSPIRSHVDQRNLKLRRFPYLSCEVGGGMASSYDQRIHITPRDTAALALVKLGSGNNLPGYYVFQGGINPDGKLSTMNESKASGYPNDLPVKDYDFTAPLGACGQVREQYHWLRQQHLFLRDFGAALAHMPAYFPERQPSSLDDVDTVRWSVRSDGQRGFIFFNNHQRFIQMPEKRGVQFALNFDSGTQLVPRDPINLPSGAFGFWPVNSDCGGVALDYATAQPLCCLDVEGQRWFFFSAIEGIAPEFAFAGEPPRRCTPGDQIAFRRTGRTGWKVNFVVLTPEGGRQLWKLPLAERDHVVLSPNALLPDTEQQLRIETLGDEQVRFAVFPPLPDIRLQPAEVKATKRGVFTEYRRPRQAAPKDRVEATLVGTATSCATNAPNAMDESAWANAAVWRVAIPESWKRRATLLRIHFIGDVARLYAGGKLVADKFYNGQPFDIALWRIPAHQLDQLEIRVMPLPAQVADRLPEVMRPKLDEHSPRAQLHKIETLELAHVKLTFRANTQ
jgi:hypothetical protein